MVWFSWTLSPTSGHQWPGDAPFTEEIVLWVGDEHGGVVLVDLHGSSPLCDEGAIRHETQRSSIAGAGEAIQLFWLIGVLLSWLL